jgi:hypothetical protein
MESRTEQHGNVEVGIVTHEGKDYSVLGIVITNTTITAYLGKDNQPTKWDGTIIGHYSIVASWPTPHGFGMCQVEAWVGPNCYTGRSAGEGMVFNGKRVARQMRLLNLTQNAPR